jgi:hypothetical protein
MNVKRRMRLLISTRCAPVLAVLLFCAGAGAQQSDRQAQLRSAVNPRTSRADSDLSRARAEVIEKIKQTRAGAEKLRRCMKVSGSGASKNINAGGSSIIRA